MKKNQPILQANEIYLRPFAIDDAVMVTKYCTHEAMSKNTLNIPKNYTIETAVKWLSKLPNEFEQGLAAIYAIADQQNDKLIGAIGLHFQHSFNRAEMGYWIGYPFWGKGYCTKAAKTIMHYGFTQLNLNKIYANYMVHNPASGRVMQKVGMEYEGYMKEHVAKDGEYFDIVCYGITQKQWNALQLPPKTDDLIANM